MQIGTIKIYSKGARANVTGKFQTYTKQHIIHSSNNTLYFVVFGP